MVIVMPELSDQLLHQDELTCNQETVDQLCEFGHILFSHGGKAKRVSYSTSHGETLAAVNGMEASSMVSTRLTELWIPDVRPSLKLLTEYQEGGSPLFPVDTATDCRDFFELCTGAKAIPQDKLQRLYILAFKEARVTGRIRYFMLVPTNYMLADPLTKPMTSRVMMQALSTGFIEFGNEEKHQMVLRRLPTLQELHEEDLIKSDVEIKQMNENKASKTTIGFAAAALWTKRLLPFMLVTSVTAVREEDDKNYMDWIFPALLILSYVVMRSIEEMIRRMFRSPTETPMRHDKNSKKKKTDDDDNDDSPAPTSSQRTRESRTTKIPPSKVYIAPSGDCYHMNPQCSGLKKATNHSTKHACKLCATEIPEQKRSLVFHVL